MFYFNCCLNKIFVIVIVIVIYNGSTKCDHSQGNYTKTQVTLTRDYQKTIVYRLKNVYNYYSLGVNT